MPNPTYIATPPNAEGTTSHQQPGTVTEIASAVVGAIGPVPAADALKLGYIFIGTGVPAIAASNGAIFLRTDATVPAASLYQRIAGAWVAIVGT